MRQKLTTLAILLACFGQVLFAQAPANDECDGAILLEDVTNFCSAPGAFTNVNATPSGFGDPTCFSPSGNDVWFVFFPQAFDVTITILGNAAGSGTLNLPEAALYSGSCNGTINQLDCESDTGNNSLELFRAGLEIGVPHYIRIRGSDGNEGTFQLCINNYFPPASPGSDCDEAAYLCNKDPFVVQAVEGAGDDATEANGTACSVSGGNVEMASTWFIFTADNNGQLTFTLTPLRPDDDLDFTVYELPSWPQTCADKVELRCMFSGDFNFPSDCMGPTGLAFGETDIGEPGGCDDPSQNNFLAPLDMIEGRHYAIMVNNFTSSDSGFEIEFGGDGEFRGPTTDIAIEPATITTCIAEPLSFTDLSSFPFGTIDERIWSFGPGSSMLQAIGEGPHDVSWDEPGEKVITLTVTTDRGCIETVTRNITVECCEGHFAVDSSTVNVSCFGFADGAIDLSISNNFGPYGYNWSDEGPATEDRNGLVAGPYTVSVVDEAGCELVLDFSISQPDTILLNPAIVMPTCNGGTDGSVDLQVTGGTPPYLYSWQNGPFQSDNTLVNIMQGDYPVTVRDDNGCEASMIVEVRELELILDPDIEAVTPPSCTGFSDGRIVIVIDNGLPPYQYNFNNGLGFQDENSLLNIPAGTYNVDVLDANLCVGSFALVMNDPPPVDVTFSTTNVSCFGLSDGIIVANPTGGTGVYNFEWSVSGSTDTIRDLAAGTYTLTLTDSNGCELIRDTVITQPNELFIDVVNVVDVICFGDTIGSIEVIGSGGTGPYTYSVLDRPFQTDPVLGTLMAGTYEVTVQDAMGCEATTEATIDSPPELLVDAGPDQSMDLGFTVNLSASSSEDPDVTYAWTPVDSLSCVDCPNPVAGPTQSTVYTVTVTNPSGCTAQDSLLVEVFLRRPIYWPNAFSPNDDGVNDFFTLFGGRAARRIVTLKVFNRWGGLVYEGEDLPLGVETLGWNGVHKGEDVNTGVFVFVAEVEFVDNVVEVFKGDVTVLK